MNDGGPAFPQHIAFDQNVSQLRCTDELGYGNRWGLSILDWFAGQALPCAFQAQAMQMAALVKIMGDTKPEDEAEISSAANEGIANMAYEIAAAMLAERERRMKESNAK